jgi:hypothetical protein
MTEYPFGWTCEITILRFERYLHATLPLDESLALAEHIEACVNCAERLLVVELTCGSRVQRGR